MNERKVMEQKPRILIVDDEPGIVESLTLTFEEDYEVFSATAAEAAVGLLKKHEGAGVGGDKRGRGVAVSAQAVGARGAAHNRGAGGGALRADSREPAAGQGPGRGARQA